MTDLDRTHDPARRSWVDSANGHPEFPIQNLPFGAVSASDDELPEVVVAIGDSALRLAAAFDAGLGAGLPIDPAMGPFLLEQISEESPETWTALRLEISDALNDPAWASRLQSALVPRAGLRHVLPIQSVDYTDFYASIHHATNVGSMFRPDNPLLPNYKWVPIGYHGRASSIIVGGTPVRRPHGQTRGPDESDPTFGPSRSLDYELELGLIIGGSNALGTAVTAASARSRIFGVSLLNDWSARDMQAWEYQPLGPFLAKNFATSLAPWIITADALKPFRVPMPSRADGDPAPLPYLRVDNDHTWGIELDVLLSTAEMRGRGDTPFRVSRARFEDAMYWSPAQLVTHHGSNGCNLSSGDLLGTGTISGPAAGARGCLLERTWRGAEPLTLPDGTTRRFLEDGDEVTLTGRCTRDGAVTIGLGECSGVVLPA